MVCLFLLALLHTPALLAQQWTFDEPTRQAYERVLNLQTEEVIEQLPHPKTIQEHYVVSLAEALELLVTEDHHRFAEFERHFERQVDRHLKAANRDQQFLLAELHLQWAFVYLKFGHELDAAHNLREAYHISEACRKLYPDYLAIQKTTGLLDVILGSVPEKYNWLLALLGMNGSIADGMEQLNRVRTSDSPLAMEADLLQALVNGFVLQKPEAGLKQLRQLLDRLPDNRLALFFAASLAIKDSQSDLALSFLETLEKQQGLSITYEHYLRGEVYLHRGEYPDAVASYRWFINHYHGENYLKDAYYKIGLCYLLSGNINDAHHLFRDARAKGKESSEADKAAARALEEKELPNTALARIRYSIDGGYYDEARKQLIALSDKDLPTRKDQVEYYYRKARLEHKTNQPEAAKLFYHQAVDMAGDEPWYFAPNACLQLGYIAEQENKTDDAKNFFQKALTYKKHEYKNSIDSKARSALNRLKQ